MQVQVTMVENDLYFLESWKLLLGNNVIFNGYQNVEIFEDDLRKNKQSILDSDCIILDFDFGRSNAGEKDLANYIRKRGFKGKIYLCSLFDDFGEFQKKVDLEFDSILEKVPLNYDELCLLLKKDD